MAAAPASYESYLCYYKVGGKERRLDEAAARLDRLCTEDGAYGWPFLVRALVAYERREPAARERALHERAAELLAAAREARGEVIARSNLRRLLVAAADPAGAQEQVDKALRAASASPDREARLRASILEASHLFHLGQDLGRAHRALLRAEADAFPDGPPGLQQAVLRHLSNFNVQLGRYEEAVAQFQRRLELFRQFGNLVEVPSLQFNIANARLEQREERPRPGALAELRELAEAALTSARESADAAASARSEALLADLWSVENPARAQRHLQRCLAVARTLRERTMETHCLASTAKHLAATWPAEAERALARALDGALHEGSDLWTAYVSQVRLRTVWHTRPKGEAAAESLRMLAVLESLRAAQSDPEARVGVLKHSTKDYRWLAGRLLAEESPDVARAFEVSERLRARVLLERLEAAGLGTPSSGQQDGELRRLRADIAGVQRRLLDPALPPAERAERLARLRTLELDERDRQAALEAAGTTSARAPRPVALAEAQQRLAPDELVLVFLVGLDRELLGGPAGGSWLFVISRDRAGVRRIPDRMRLEDSVPMFTGMIEGRDGSELPASVALHDQLLGDVLEKAGPAVRRVIVVPDGVLHRLPFAALRPRAPAEPLGVRYELVMAPSVTLWARGKASEVAPSARAAALVVAAPELPAAGAPAAAERSGVLAGGLALGPLPHARREGSRVRGAVGHGSELLSGAEATEASLKRKDLAPFGVLHFATHAVADDAYPDRSAVLLASGSATEDGLLQPREISALDLRGRAVILSACQTAAGPYVDGEGVFSLARAFFEGGARTIVAGLWRLRDDETERLMLSFYDGVAEGRTMAASLRWARERAVTDGLPTAAWAGVVLLGDADLALPHSPSSAWPARVAWASGVVLAAGLAAWWRRRQR